MAFRSSLFYLTLILLTLILGILGIPLLLTFNCKWISKIGEVWGGCALKFLKLICGLDYKIEGLKNLPAGQPVIVASKHSSAWETIFLLKLLHPAAFILKRELVRIPIYGWYLPAMGMISISRSDKIQAIKKVIRGSKDRLAKGFNIVIFPEVISRRLEDPRFVDAALLRLDTFLSENKIHNTAEQCLILFR